MKKSIKISYLLRYLFFACGTIVIMIELRLVQSFFVYFGGEKIINKTYFIFV